MAAKAPDSSAAAAPKQQQPPEPAKPREYNPRWLGYTYIILTSLVCFASIANIPGDENDFVGSVAFGVTTFSISLLILLFDRFRCIESFNFSKAYDGKLEGFTLVLFVILWIVGVALLTKPGGLGYSLSNVFFSSWLALAACIYTLDEWSSAKDIISIRELTQLSATLKSWYALFLCSLVHFGSAINVLVVMGSSRWTGDAAFSIALGAVSTLISLLFILVHYKFFKGIKQGGWLELATAFFLILMWTIAVAILTGYNGLAPTILGSNCRTDVNFDELENCTVTIEIFDEKLNATLIQVETCKGVYKDEVPGSNLYFSAWGALFSSINLTLRWKAAQALQFAQSAQSRRQRGATPGAGEDEDDDYDDEI